MFTDTFLLRTYNAGRYLLSTVLFLSGISKFFYIQGFASEVAQYSELYVSSAFVPWSKWIAIAVCCVEIVSGVSLVVPKLSKLACIAVFALMTFFLYLTGVNYLFPTIFGSVESCGCFGELVHFTAKGSFLKSIILWVISFTTIIVIYKNSRPTERGK